MKLIKHLIIVIVAVMCLRPDSLRSQTNWTNYAENPVIDSNFDPEALAILRPSVVYDGDSYHMWYTDLRVFPLPEGQLHLGCMAYATSPDGVSWQSVNTVVMQPALIPNAFDAEDAGQGWVIAENDTFKMWYWGYNPMVRSNSIGYAWSLDGSHWTKVAGPGALGSVYDRDMAGLPDTMGVAMPCVVKDGNTYHMWHTQIVDDPDLYRIGYATSTDGIHWTKVSGAGRDGSVIDWGTSDHFDHNSASWPAVIKTDDGFMMWYFGVNGAESRIGCSISSDGITWNSAPGVDAAGACFEGALGTCIIPMDTQYKMWYAPGDKTVSLAFSDYNTGVRGPDNPASPEAFTLEQNFPNPFNPSTIIGYSVKEPCPVNLVVYNVTGRIVKTLVSAYQQAGIYSIPYHMQDNPSGIYFYKIRMGEYEAVRKMVKIE